MTTNGDFIRTIPLDFVKDSRRSNTLAIISLSLAMSAITHLCDFTDPKLGSKNPQKNKIPLQDSPTNCGFEGLAYSRQITLSGFLKRKIRLRSTKLTGVK